MQGNSPHLAVLVYDLAATGVVRNALRIAGRAAAEGLRTELWVVREHGAFAANLPPEVGVVQIDAKPSTREAQPLGNWQRGLSTLAAVPGLARLIKTRAPRIVLSAGNHFHLYAGLAYRLAGRPAGTRLIGRASNATPRLGHRRSLAGTLANLLDAGKYAEMHRIVAVSQELAGDLSARLRISGARIVVVPNGIDMAEVSRRASEALDDPWFSTDAPPVIVSAGRLSKQKNFPLLIDAFSRLRRHRPARLLILGDGSPRARERLTGQAVRLGVDQDMRLAGYVANPLRYFSRANLFVLSSLWEGASNVLLEALAAGCPVIATDCPTGVRELLDGGRVGAIIPPNDPASLAEAIDRRLHEPRHSDELRAHAAKFDESSMLDGYIRLFREEGALGAPPSLRSY